MYFTFYLKHSVKYRVSGSLSLLLSFQEAYPHFSLPSVLPHRHASPKPYGTHEICNQGAMGNGSSSQGNPTNLSLRPLFIDYQVS